MMNKLHVLHFIMKACYGVRRVPTLQPHSAGSSVRTEPCPTLSQVHRRALVTVPSQSTPSCCRRSRLNSNWLPPSLMKNAYDNLVASQPAPACRPYLTMVPRDASADFYLPLPAFMYSSEAKNGCRLALPFRHYMSMSWVG